MLKSFILTLALSAFGAGWAQAQPTHAFTNARIVPISGPVIEKGTLVVRDGKIVAVGASVPVPAGAETHDLAGKTIMPGLVDSHSHIASPAGGDASAPIQPDVRVLDSVNARHRLSAAQAGGITTANIMPGSGHLSSGQTLYLKLRGRQTIDELMVTLPDGRIAGGLKMANGTNSIRTQAPISGHTWQVGRPGARAVRQGEGISRK